MSCPAPSPRAKTSRSPTCGRVFLGSVCACAACSPKERAKPIPSTDFSKFRRLRQRKRNIDCKTESLLDSQPHIPLFARKTPFDSHSSMVEAQRSQLLKKYHRPRTLVI